MRYSTRPFTAVSLVSYSGWGGYGLLNAAAYLDRKHRFRVGTTPKFYVIRSSRFRRDRWFAAGGVRRQFLKAQADDGSLVSTFRDRMSCWKY